MKINLIKLDGKKVGDINIDDIFLILSQELI